MPSSLQSGPRSAATSFRSGAPASAGAPESLLFASCAVLAAGPESHPSSNPQAIRYRLVLIKCLQFRDLVARFEVCGFPLKSLLPLRISAFASTASRGARIGPSIRRCKARWGVTRATTGRPALRVTHRQTVETKSRPVEVCIRAQWIHLTFWREVAVCEELCNGEELRVQRGYQAERAIARCQPAATIVPNLENHALGLAIAELACAKECFPFFLDCVTRDRRDSPRAQSGSPSATSPVSPLSDSSD